MLISEAIEQANVLTGQSLPVEALVRWLSEMDGRLAFEFYRAEGWLPYDPVDDMETELLVPFPWDGMYVHHLEAMTYFTNAEYDRYENARTLSEKTLADFRAFMQRTQAKLCGGGFPTEKTGGTYTTVIPEQAQSPWFWVNAYSLAVQHGFAGTEDEWLESLVGPNTVTNSTSTNLTGILKGNGSAVSAIANGTTGQLLKMGESGPEWGAWGGADPYSSNPAMNGTASPGVSSDYSRGDHVHPSDTTKLGTSGDGSNVTAAFTTASTRANISTGEKLGILFGKIAKWFADLGAAAFRGVDSAPTAGSTNLVTSDGIKSALNTVDESIAIRVFGNKTTYASGAAIGQYVIVDGSTITGITDGLYKAAKAIPYNTVIDSTYLTAASGGGLNDLMSAMYIDKRTVNYRNLNAGVNYVNIPNIPSGYKPMMALGYNTSNEYGYLICGVRFISTEYKLGIYSVAANNYVTGDLYFLFVKE